MKSAGRSTSTDASADTVSTSATTVKAATGSVMRCNLDRGRWRSEPRSWPADGPKLGEVALAYRSGVASDLTYRPAEETLSVTRARSAQAPVLA